MENSFTEYSIRLYSEKDKYSMVSLICGIQKKIIKQTSEYNKKETDSDIENKLVVPSGESKQGRGKIGVED